MYRLDSGDEDEVIVSCKHSATIYQNQLKLQVTIGEQNTLKDPNVMRETEYFFKITVFLPVSFTCVHSLPGKILQSDVFTISKHVSDYGKAY